MTSKSSILIFLLVSTVLTAPALAGKLQSPRLHVTIPHYVVKDVGAFGGSYGQYSNPASRVINARGEASGVNGTGAEDPFCPDWCFFDGNVDHAFLWNHGTTDLGGLVDGVSSWAIALNDKGVSTGVSQTGETDPDTGAPTVHSVRWRNGVIEDLGTLGGSQSGGNAIDKNGRVAGVSAMTASDDFIDVPQANCKWLPTTLSDCAFLDFGVNALFLPVTTQTHAVLWSKTGSGRDIGTLGGPDSTTIDINASGQVVGWSYVSNEAGPSGVPDTHPFLWDHGSMTDLGTLGGTVSAAVQINSNGVVIGASNTADDAEVHPFIWDSEHGMRDIDLSGATYAHPDWINDNNQAVGYSRAGSARHAFYYDGTTTHDLGTLGDDPASEGFSINNSGIIVGLTFVPGGDDLRGFVSDNGGPLVDLNTLIRHPHKYYIISAVAINDRGEIAAQALLRNGEIHPVVLIPENESGATDALHDVADEGKAMTAGEARLLLQSRVHRADECKVRRLRPHFCTAR